MMGGMAVDESALRELSRADVVAFGPVGFAATTLPVTEAYERLAHAVSADGVDLRPHLDRLLAEATPAGKAYAATLLTRLDADAGREAWRSLATDPSEITTFIGCVMNRTTLAEYAAGYLDPS
jgi:hypothetical protein